jgi:hypothetical protein
MKRKAGPGARKRRAAASGAKAAPRAGRKKKAPRAAPKAKHARPSKARGVRVGSRTETILALLKRPGGAGLKEIMEEVGWQAHSVRAFISVLGKKMSRPVASAKGEDGERNYSIRP